MKKIIFALAGVVMSCALLAGNSFAATQWAACTPAQIGPYGAIVRVQLTGCNINPAGAMGGWMTLSTTGTDQMMATILTAMSLNKAVAIAFDDAGATVDAEGYNFATALILNNL
mgnify:CR=1 FL=1